MMNDFEFKSEFDREAFDDLDSGNDEEFKKEMKSRREQKILDKLTDDIRQQYITGKFKSDAEPALRKTNLYKVHSNKDLVVPQAARDMFYYLKVKKEWRFIILKCNEKDPTFVEIERCGARDQRFATMKELLPKDRARWIIFEIPMETKSKDSDKSVREDHTILIKYSPEANKNAEKQIVKDMTEELKKKLVEHTLIKLEDFYDANFTSYDEFTQQKLAIEIKTQKNQRLSATSINFL